jgi:hypothetical protein
VINKDIPYLYTMKSFKFLRNNPSIPKTFNLNIMEDPLSRIPSYNVYIEPYEFNVHMEHTDSICNIINGVTILPTMIFNGVLLKRRDGSYTEINHNNVDELNQQGLIFDMNDRITLRYKI